MKRIFIFITISILSVCLSCCSRSNKQDFYGTYTFKEVSYLSRLSSYTPGYLNEKMAGTKYTIKADLFKVESADNTFEISSPIYVKEDIPKDLSPLPDDVKQQYTIYNKDRSKTKWRLYASSDSLWVSTYADNTADGSEIIMYIYKLSK